MAVLDDPKYVTDLRPCDVLFGRGSGPNDHEGNIRFRQLVAERKAEYMATNHRLTKAKIAKEIVNQVFLANGRFMKKVEASELSELGLPEGSDIWEVVGDDTIMEKAKQALRQNTQKNKDDNTRAISPKQSRPRSRSPKVNRSAARPVMRTAQPTRFQQDNRMQNLNLDEFEPIPLPSQRFRPQQAPVNRQPVPVHSWGEPQQQMHQMPQPNAVRELVPIFPVSGDDTMLSHVRQSAFARNNDASMANLPQDDVPVRGKPAPNFRGSLTLDDLKSARDNRRIGAEMKEMTDSFKGMRTSERVMGMHNSVDTMGTIEPINTHGSIADMSIGTMESSTFSFFKGNESILDDADLDEKIAQVEAEVEQEKRANKRPPPIVGASLTSVSSAQMGNMSIGSLGIDLGQSFTGGNVRSSLTAGGQDFSRHGGDGWGNVRASTRSDGINMSSLFMSKDLPPIDSEAPLDNSEFQPRPVATLQGRGDYESFDMGTSSVSHLKSSLSLQEASDVTKSNNNNNSGYRGDNARQRFIGSQL